MITTPEEYKSFLYQLQNPNRQTQAIILPNNEPLYEIDLNTRNVMAPSFLSMEYDHNAETIYFIVDRYYDNVDLSTLSCVVQYENASPDPRKRGYIYSVPYFDISGPFVPEGKMIFPWAIQGPATAYAGTVTFSVKFYRIREILTGDSNGDEWSRKEYDYLLNTIPKQSQVLHGLDIYEVSENYIYDVATVEEIYFRINQISQQQDLYWTILEVPTPTTHVNPTIEGATDKSNDIYENLS